MSGTAGPATPAQLLAWAELLLARHDGVSAWSRAVAVLARQALEAALVELWRQRRVALEACSFHAQLLCLARYLGDAELAARARWTWTALSGACHHHPYELAPTAAELDTWLASVRALVEAVTGTAATSSFSRVGSGANLSYGPTAERAVRSTGPDDERSGHHPAAGPSAV